MLASFLKLRKMRIRVAALIENANGEVLLIKQKKKNKEYWLLPGGGIEFGESAEFALKRELKEELNLNVDSADFLLANESIDPNKKRHLIQLIFKTKVLEKPEIKEKTVTDFAYFKVQDILQLDLRPDIKQYFQNQDKLSSSFISSKWINE